MTFEFELGETRIWCSSPECTRKLLGQGARLANPAQSDQLRRVLESAEPCSGGKAGAEASGRAHA